ncbi:MAG: DEAD/DEAH box helicase, partial [Phycisphaeraceae bacterium]
QIRRIIADALPTALPQIHDHFDEAYRAARELPELRDAYRALHTPNDSDELVAARRRLAYDELLLLQLGFALKRQHTQNTLTAPALRYSEAIDGHIRQRFPFALTEAQQRVIDELSDDLQRTIPMNRLLQGDVGSGKTVVALYALLLAVASQKQGVLMAPTELLAEQHFASISKMLADSSVRLTLLTGSLTSTERAVMRSRIQRGEVDIVVGTQAMLSEDVRFADLALAVVDEQHRFGVVQRAAMRAKTHAENTLPHTLVMTAKPIHRTLSLSVFGDLDVSTIDQLPPGRQPITTRVVTPDKADDVYAYAARRVAKGEQAYIVLPSIEDSENGAELKAVRSHTAHLEKTH